MSESSQLNRTLYYSPDGNKVIDQDSFLTDLWNYLSIKEGDSFLAKAASSQEESLDYSKILGPIAAAHQEIKAVIMILDSILGTGQPGVIGFSKLAQSAPDTNPIINFQTSFYLESAKKLRHRAELLKKQIFIDIKLNLVAKKFSGLGWPVEYSFKHGCWLVDYGYKSRFVHFWEHLKGIEERGTFAIISEGNLVFPSNHLNSRLVFNGDQITPEIYGENNASAVLLAAQQSLIEADFFEEQLVPAIIEIFPKAQVSTNKIIVPSENLCIELTSLDPGARERYTLNRSLLRGIYEYLKDPTGFNPRQFISGLLNAK